MIEELGLRDYVYWYVHWYVCEQYICEWYVYWYVCICLGGGLGVGGSGRESGRGCVALISIQLDTPFLLAKIQPSAKRSSKQEIHVVQYRKWHKL